MSENLIHKIKVPIFSSELKEEILGELKFNVLDYKSMLDYIKKKIDTFNNANQNLVQPKNNKVKETQISKIDFFDSEFERIPTLLLKITAFSTNLIDGFIETVEKRNFERNDKIGSETNFVLIFPRIYGSNSSKFTYQWHFFVYDDPTKESSEIISICKLVCRKVLNIKIKNLKLEKILKDIKTHEVIESIEIQLSSHHEETDDPDIKLKSFLVSSKVAKTTKNLYKDLPSDIFETIINESGGFFKRIFRIKNKNKELKITQEKFQNEKEKISSTIEEIFNNQLELNNNDLEHLFNFDFIIKNLNLALTDFMKESN